MARKRETFFDGERMSGRTDNGLVRIVLDTSVFTNPDSSSQWGKSSMESIRLFLEQARAARERVAFFMPHSVYEELNTYLSNETIPPEFEILVSLQSPNRYGIMVPGFLLYELIEDIRERINKGLRVAEKAVREAQAEHMEKSITRLREKYRAALREGILDSREDADLVLLAMEREAALVSSDRGVTRWAEKAGVRLIDPLKLRSILEELSEGESQ